MSEMRSDRSPYRDFRHEPVAATPGQPELPVDPEDNQTGEAMVSDSLVKFLMRMFRLLNLFLPISSLRIDFYPFAAGPNANVLGFLRAAILVMPKLIIVWLMIAILPVLKTVRPLILQLMMSTALVTRLLAVMLVTAMLRITALPVTSIVVAIIILVVLSVSQL